MNRKPSSRARKALTAFRRDDRGNAALMVTLALPLLMLSIGGAMDYARALDARARLQSAVDAALLATASHRLANAGISDGELLAYFRRMLREARDKRLQKKLQLDVAGAALTREDDVLQARVSGTFTTTFMRLAGIDTMPIGVTSETRAGFARLEVALVLDVTGSMARRGGSGSTKLAELKLAAKEFVDTIANRFGNASPELFRLAIVPFSQYVNVGTRYASADWLLYRPADQQSRNRLARRGIVWEGCVGSRQAPWNTRDESYAVHKVPIVMKYPRNTNFSVRQPRGYRLERRLRNFCPPPILPLTSAIDDKATIEAAIDGLEADGWTYIPAGLMWGWRVLSPGEPFTEGADDETVKSENVRKIIILMTDGANTRAPVQSSGWAWKDHQEGNRARADNFTRQACSAIKATNPGTGRPYAEIITVTFDVRSDSIRQLMRDCASIGSYDAQVGELQQLFRTIAEQVSDLYLSG